MTRIFKIIGLDNEPVGSLSVVGGDPYWRTLQDITADHFGCNPDEVGCTEPTDAEPDEYITIAGETVALLLRIWRR